MNGHRLLPGNSRILSWVLAILVLSTGLPAAQDFNPKLSRRDTRPTLSSQAGAPVVDYTAHNRGNIQLAVANNGTFGTLGSTIPDPFTGEIIPSCIYPKNTDLVYLWVAAIWIGAVVGRDTLVTCGNEDWYVTEEFWPEVEPFKPKGGFTYGSIDVNSPFFSSEAYSEQDIYCEYTDTLDDPAIVQADIFDTRSHRPLGIKVSQLSMGWSYSYADDFILFDYRVENIGERDLSNVYIGIYADGDVWHTSRNSPEGWNDDIVGYYPTHPAPEGCGFFDTINVAYHADNDGDPENGVWNEKSALGAVGVRVVRTPAEDLKLSYNWWIINYGDPTGDFGPRKKEVEGDPYRDFGPRMGTPLGDKNKYYMLRHEEFDYDLLFTAIDHQDDGYLPPPEDAEEFAQGYDTRYLLSFGPFDISPGQRLPVSFAWVGGENLHQDPEDFATLFDPHHPEIYYNSLDFDNLATNSRWASWVYDNPGVDTDGDGYFGKFRVCTLDSTFSDTGGFGDSVWVATVAETTYYEGDGVADFKGAGPPPAPRIRVLPGEGELTVRWNGYYTETTPDVFLGLVDFEGYRVYIANDDRQESFSVLASYDHENYNRYVLRQITSNEVAWVLEDLPFSIEELRTMFGDPDFDPLQYSRTFPFLFDGEQYYFEPQDFNYSDLTQASGIHKVYPGQPRPSPNRADWRSEDLVYDYGEPLPKYYEYEYVIRDLLPTVPYNCAVTAFDFGSPKVGLQSLETWPVNNMVSEYPQYNAETVERENLDVYVYPNPYRIDANYRELGFEGRGVYDRPDDRVRAIHFANLPPKCTIKIFSLDGDLVREIKHDVPANDPQSGHDSWDLITRNTQTTVSGLYYWVVESEDRTQIGKVAIIR